jgi:ribosomal-protein-alanine acetyltransferase
MDRPIAGMIRQMVSGEAEAVEAIWAASPGASQWSAGDLLQLSRSGTRIWVAQDAGQIVGAAALRTAGDEAEVLNLGVAPSLRRRGLGRELLAAAISDARHAGAARIFLEVRESNLGAQAFYRNLGFAEIGRRRAYYRDPAEDALVLSVSVLWSQWQTHFGA